MPKTRMQAMLLCFVLGPFGLIYLDKKAGIFLSALLVFTLFAGFIAMAQYSIGHPATAQDIDLLMSGEISENISGIKSIFFIEAGAIVLEWAASMIWALVLPRAQS